MIEQAFPKDGGELGRDHPGLSKREYAAIHLTAGLLANPEWIRVRASRGSYLRDETLVEAGVRLADSLLEKLKPPIK